jgi:hypothetical protein
MSYRESRHAIVKGASVGGRTTAQESFEQISVCRLPGQNHGASFYRIGSTRVRVIHCSRHLWENEDDLEGDLVDNAHLGLVTLKDSSQHKAARLKSNG